MSTFTKAAGLPSLVISLTAIRAVGAASGNFNENKKAGCVKAR